MKKSQISNHFILIGSGPLKLYFSSGRSGGGAPPMHALPTGSIPFIFAYVFGKKCMHRRLAPPPMVQCPPPMGNPGSATKIRTAIQQNIVDMNFILNLVNLF